MAVDTAVVKEETRLIKAVTTLKLLSPNVFAFTVFFSITAYPPYTIPSPQSLH